MEHAKHVVGCVPYVNALPLIARAEESGLGVIYDAPARLPELLEKGAAEAVLVSSYEALAGLHRTVVDGLCIGSEGTVMSVKLVSQVPFEKVRRLALDASSMTSNALARIVLRRRWEASPELSTLPPDEDAMLAESDACVLIGDRGLEAGKTAPFVLDLGEAWTEMTGLPFVWAMWTGYESLPPSLAASIHAAALPSLAAGSELSEADITRAVELALDTVSWPEELVRRYFRECMRYQLDSRAWKGLAAFGVLLVEHRLARQVGMPSRVSPTGHAAAF